MRRIVLTGSESTGKTTLARALADRLGVMWVPEFVRDFAERKGGTISFSDHGPIARGQMALEDEHAAQARARGDSLLILDTDLVSTVVYCEHYFGRCPEWIEETARARLADLYLLCDIDHPWIADGVRDRGDRREELHAAFEGTLRRLEARYVVIRGDGPARLQRATLAIQEGP